MPMLHDSAEALLHVEEEVRHRAKSFWSNFTDFAIRDNVLDVAVGLVVAAAFTGVVTSFMSDILLPPISLLPFINKQFEEKFAVLREGPSYDTNQTNGYNTLKQAIDDGAIVLAYGNFIDKIVNFLGIGITLYIIAISYAALSEDTIIHAQKKCQFCKKYISANAKRCPMCTSWFDGREMEWRS